MDWDCDHGRCHNLQSDTTAHPGGKGRWLSD